MADLIKVRGCDNPGRRGDVIFVHGLNGNPREYWWPQGEPEKFWPAWVGEDLPDVGVWSLGYENAALKPRRFSFSRKFLQGGFAMPLEDRADNVLLRLESDHIGERPLVFITHSMGGLLIKEVLRTANDSSNPRRKAIVEQTRGVCFIATPHIGSDLAKWASYFKTLLGTNVAMDELRPHEPHLRKLNQWYRDFVAPEHRRIKTLSFYEMKPTAVIGRLVVEPGDADPGVPHAGLHPLDKDHASICKPGSKNHQIHVTVTNFIRRDCLQLDDVRPSVCRTISPQKPDILTTQDPTASAAADKPDTSESIPSRHDAGPEVGRANAPVTGGGTTSLTGPQVKQLQEAIKSGFTVAELEQLVLFKLNERFDNITTDASLSTVVFELIQWTERNGRTSELIRAVEEARPNKEEIQKIAKLLLLPSVSSKPRPRPSVSPGEVISAEVNSRTVDAQSDESLSLDGEDKSRWESYRLSIRKRLEELLEEVRGTPVSMRLSQALGIEYAPSDEISVKKRIADYLMEAQDKYAIPKIVRVHEELCNESSDRLADKIAECVDRILPLYFSREAVSKAWRQLQVQKVVLIEGTVATVTGAELIFSHVDGTGPSFLPQGHPIPRGKTLVPFETPAIGEPSSEAEVLAILEDLAKGAGVVSIDRAGARGNARMLPRGQND
jgi:pimeloyl-ACP methyl ester carboxylesterase